MAKKETFYFPHDYNAAEDEKILRLLSAQGWEGYGLYWGIIEKLASSSEAKLKLSDIEYLAFGMRTQCERIDSVVRNYNLFIIKGDYFWSNRLISFFKEKETKSTRARESAKVRWAMGLQEPTKMRTQCERNANASKNDAIKKRKGKKRKENNNTQKALTISLVDENTKQKRKSSAKKKKDYESLGEFKNIKLTKEEQVKLRQKHGVQETENAIVEMSLWLKQNNKTYKDYYAALLNWIRRREEKTNPTKPVPKYLTYEEL